MQVTRISAVVHEYGGRVYKVGEKVVLEDEKHLLPLLMLGKLTPEPGDHGYVEPSEAPRGKRGARR